MCIKIENKGSFLGVKLVSLQSQDLLKTMASCLQIMFFNSLSIVEVITSKPGEVIGFILSIFLIISSSSKKVAHLTWQPRLDWDGTVVHLTWQPRLGWDGTVVHLTWQPRLGWDGTVHLC